MLPSKEMLTTGEVAQALGVTINTVKNWVAAGRLDAVRLPSGHYRIPRNGVERLLGGPAREELRERVSERAEGWEQYESWRRAQPSREVPLAEALAWAGAMLDLARSQGPIPEPSLDEKAERVRRLHMALGRLSR